jgi:hypothetical protein
VLAHIDLGVVVVVDVDLGGVDAGSDHADLERVGGLKATNGLDAVADRAHGLLRPFLFRHGDPLKSLGCRPHGEARTAEEIHDAHLWVPETSRTAANLLLTWCLAPEGAAA